MSEREKLQGRADGPQVPRPLSLYQVSKANQDDFPMYLLSSQVTHGNGEMGNAHIEICDILKQRKTILTTCLVNF